MRGSEPIPGLTVSAAAFLASRRVGRLATVDAAGQPHAVPICYTFDGESISLVLDSKPKRVPVTALKRVRNILAHPQAAVLVDDYAEDWSQLAYVLVHGQAALVMPGDPPHAPALAGLRAKYPQYRQMSLDDRPVIRVMPTSATAWGHLETPAGTPPLSRLELLPAIRGRRSVRAYSSQPVPRALLDACIESAGWAPSPHGRQPWRFALITSMTLKERLADAMGAEWRRNLALDGEREEIVETRLRKSRARLLGAPVLVLACLYLADLDVYPDAARQAAEHTMAVQSLGAAVQNLLLTAYHLGLDTSWMCAPLFCPEVVASALDLAPGLIPHALLTVGYAAHDPVRRPRLPLEQLIVLDA